MVSVSWSLNTMMTELSASWNPPERVFICASPGGHTAPSHAVPALYAASQHTQFTTTSIESATFIIFGFSPFRCKFSKTFSNLPNSFWRCSELANMYQHLILAGVKESCLTLVPGSKEALQFLSDKIHINSCWLERIFSSPQRTFTEVRSDT